jgi:ketosteroid isomerase-like protein
VRRILITLIGLLVSFCLPAQNFANHDLQTMVNVERAFAALARKENTRKAFLVYLSEEAVVFEQGPVNGKKRWEARPTDDSKLDWDPEFADIAASGDFGYTTGPWEYRTHRTDRSPDAHGHFVSVWQKKPNGLFQNVLDIGVSHPHDPESHPLKTSILHAKAGNDLRQKDESLLDIEQEFLTSLTDRGSKAHVQALSREARLYRTGRIPMTIPTLTRPVVEREGSSIRYSPIQGGMASSGDLGYVYGTASWTESKEGNEVHANYARIWKNEDGSRWKIVLEVVSIR